MRVAVLDDVHGAYDRTAGIERLRARAHVRVFRSPIRDVDELRGYDAIVANRDLTTFDRHTLSRLPDLRILVQVGGRLDHIDLAAAHELSIVVTNPRQGFSVGTAELTFGLLIALMRRIAASDAAIRRGEWATGVCPVLHGKTLGIVGLGRVGRHVARIANAFGMHVLAASRHLTETDARGAGAQCRDLDDLVSGADVVTIHATLSPESRGLFDTRRLGLMKTTAFLVNTARGAIVDERALIDALTRGGIAGAALDVFDKEPLPVDHPLLVLPNVLLTPHSGWPTDEAYSRYADEAADVLLHHLDGLPVPSLPSGGTR